MSHTHHKAARGTDATGLPNDHPRRKRPANGTPATALPEADLPAARGRPRTTATAPPEARASTPVKLTVEVVPGCISGVKASVAVLGQYLGLPPVGSTRLYDELLGHWIRRALEFRIINAALGSLFHFPKPPKLRNDAPLQDAILVAGMGEPGGFGRDDLQYLMTNVTLAVKALGHDDLVMPLLGSRRAEIATGRAVRAVIDGIVDGLDRFPREGAHWGLYLRLVEADADKARDIHDVLTRLAPELPPRVQLIVKPEGKWSGGKSCTAAKGATREESTTRITISSVAAGGTAPATGPAAMNFQVSALADTAVIPVRDFAVQRYFASRLPARLRTAAGADRHKLGRLLADYLVPEDFRKLIEGSDQLTLVLDPASAAFPWEMAGYRGHRSSSETCFFYGIELKLARQFRTSLSSPPGLAPRLNHRLDVLVIADPAPGLFKLPGARAEGQAVVKVLADAQAAWGDRFEFHVTVRVGPDAERDTSQLKQLHDEIRQLGGVVESVAACDPMELLCLLVTGNYDVVHYAGHGVFDEANNRMGWVFDADCTLTALDIFRARQVPRLVFANACHSAEVTQKQDPQERLQQQVSLAEAFFARGIHNYIGTGWEINDQPAQLFATKFYRHVLGMHCAAKGQVQDEDIPPSLGEGLKAARTALFDSDGTDWGAYHHYGQSSATLLDFAGDKDEMG